MSRHRGPDPFRGMMLAAIVLGILAIVFGIGASNFGVVVAGVGLIVIGAVFVRYL